MALHAGRMDRLITIEKNTPTTNPEGDEVPAWSTVATVWAEKNDKTGREFFAAGHTTVALRVTSFRIYYNAAVTELMRVVLDGIFYNIKAIQEVGRREAQVLMCQATDP